MNIDHEKLNKLNEFCMDNFDDPFDGVVHMVIVMLSVCDKTEMLHGLIDDIDRNGMILRGDTAETVDGKTVFPAGNA